ncbi:MAG TPA: mercuric reductase [Candidatus Polarisedimenticolia bacterium]|nr:mercuric reductase [Candidatus Polarisedimenticolia bacterium]
MEVDTLIIGSGQAGVPLATRLVSAGQRVLLAERARPGGTCVNYGCTPTKTMIASARAAHVARNGARLGVHARDVRVDFAQVVSRKQAVVRQWREGVEKRLREAGDGLVFVQGHARFVGPREVEVAGERHRAKTIVINVGARPGVPPIPGLETVDWLDNARAMELGSLPAHLVIIGGGYIGCEFGQMFRRFGSDVTMIDHNDHLLSREDPEISAEIEKVFRSEGIRLELGRGVRDVAGSGGGARVRIEGGPEIHGSHLLVAAGRRPNTDDLGCDAAGIRLDAKDFVVVDDHHRATAEGVYAVGDAVAQPQFTHTSWDDHRLLYDHLMGRGGGGRQGRIVPYTVFTDPQVAGVGLSEKEARRRGVAHEVAVMPFGHVARAIEVDEPAGLMKVLIDPESERILGATLVGSEAGELIHIFVALMQARAGARAIVDAQFVHPTFAEGVQSLVMRLDRFRLR